MMTFMVDGIMTYPSDSSEKPPREIPPTKLQIIRPLSPLASPSQRRMVGIRPQPPPPPPLPLPLQGHLRVKGPPRYYDDFEVSILKSLLEVFTSKL